MFEKLQGNMLSSHIGILYVMRFDKGFAYSPNGHWIVDCVESIYDESSARDLQSGRGSV